MRTAQSRIPRAHWRLIAGCFAGIGTSMVAYASMEGMLVPLQNDWNLSVDAISILSLSVLAGSMLMLLPAGELVDRWGSRRILLVGAAAAIVGAVLVTVAISMLWLVAGRILGGVGGTAMAVASMALLNASITDDRERSHVFGLFAAVTAAIFAASPVLASAISDQLSWRIVPLLWIACAGVAVALVPQQSPAPKARGDLVTPLAAGVALSGACVAALMIEQSTLAFVISLAVVVVAVIVVVVRRQWLVQRDRNSGLDLSVFAAPGAKALMGAMIAVAVVNLFFYGNLLLQYRFGLSPTQTATLLVVPQVVGVIGGLAGGWASARVGSLEVTAVALAFGCAAGLTFLSMNEGSQAASMVLPLCLFSAAAGCITGSLAKAFLDCANPAASGAAASWRQAAWSVGATFGGVATSAVVFSFFTRAWSTSLNAAGVDAYTAQWVADSARAGVPLANLASSPALNGVTNREVIDSLVGLGAAQIATFRFVGVLAAVSYGVALAFVLLALWRQRRIRPIR